MQTWIKPNGNSIDLNEEPQTVKAAESMGWKRKPEEVKEVPSKPRKK